MTQQGGSRALLVSLLLLFPLAWRGWEKGGAEMRGVEQQGALRGMSGCCDLETACCSLGRLRCHPRPLELFWGPPRGGTLGTRSQAGISWVLSPGCQRLHRQSCHPGAFQVSLPDNNCQARCVRRLRCPPFPVSHTATLRRLSEPRAEGIHL